jgi:pimeloyl-ACP methyl ester carboxylesterase
LSPSAAVELIEAGPVWAERYGLRVLAVEPAGWATPALAPEEYRPTALARRIVEQLNELDLDRVAYVGRSWGASIGCHLAATAPDRLDALVLLDAGFTDFQDSPRFQGEQDLATMTAEAIARAVPFDSWDSYLDSVRPLVRSWRPALEERVRGGMRELGAVIVPVVAPEVMAAAAHGVVIEPPSSTLAALGRLDLPILLLAASDTIGQEWGKRALDRFRAAVPRAEVVTVESGHDLLADAPEQTIRAVGEWVSGR